MDWRKELAEAVGALEKANEQSEAELSDIEGREYLCEQHLLWMLENAEV